MKRWTGVILAGILLCGCGGQEPQEMRAAEEPALLDTLEDPYAYAEEYVSHHVPYVYRYLMSLELCCGAEERIEDEAGNHYYSFGIGETDGTGAFRPVRMFAMNAEGTDMYEYDARTDQWYLREDGPTELELTRIRADLQFQDSLGGFAWIGQDEIESSWMKRCPWLEELETIDAGGSEYYLVMPQDQGVKFTVERTADGKAVDMYYASVGGEPVIVKAGDPDRFADIVITFSYAGRTASFVPYHAWLPVYDTANDELIMNVGLVDYYGLADDRTRLQETIIAAYPEMQQNFASGMIMSAAMPEIIELDHRPCWKVYCGTDHDGIFTRERTFAVSDDYMHVYAYSAAEDAWNEQPD